MRDEIVAAAAERRHAADCGCVPCAAARASAPPGGGYSRGRGADQRLRAALGLMVVLRAGTGSS